MTLDTLVAAYDQGATADEIVRRFSVLDLQEVYTVLGFFLEHEDMVRAHLKEREQAAQELRRKLEAEGIALSEEEMRERLREKRKRAEQVETRE